MPSIQDLLREGRIESVPADLDTAASMLEESQRHLFSADQRMALDPTGAYSLLYDAARKASPLRSSAHVDKRVRRRRRATALSDKHM